LRYCIHSALGVMRRIWSDSASTDAGRAVELLERLDGWFVEQQRAPLPASIHELLTHVVDGIGGVCGAVQKNISGEAAAPRATQIQQ
jgi:hypothetical protein